MNLMIARQQQLGIELPYDDIAALCQRYGVVELSIFGSVLRDDFHPDSDVDFLTVFKDDDLGPWMCRLTDFQAELSLLLKRESDVVLRSGVEKSENYIRRRHILQSAKPVYVA